MLLVPKESCEDRHLTYGMAQLVSLYKAIVNVLPYVCEYVASGRKHGVVKASKYFLRMSHIQYALHVTLNDCQNPLAVVIYSR